MGTSRGLGRTGHMHVHNGQQVRHVCSPTFHVCVPAMIRFL